MFVIMEFVQESKNKITKDKSGLTHILQLRSEKKKQCITDNKYHYDIINILYIVFHEDMKNCPVHTGVPINGIPLHL